MMYEDQFMLDDKTEKMLSNLRCPTVTLNKLEKAHKYDETVKALLKVIDQQKDINLKLQYALSDFRSSNPEKTRLIDISKEFLEVIRKNGDILGLPIPCCS